MGKNLHPLHIIPPLPPLKLSTVKYPFLPVIPLDVWFLHEVFIILTLGCFIIYVSHVVAVRIILNNKFLTQASIGIARMVVMLPTIPLMDWNMSKLRNISFSIKLLCKYKFSYSYKLFDKLTYSKLLISIRTIE